MKRLMIRVATAAAMLAVTVGGVAIYLTASAPAAYACDQNGGGGG
jgi:hypothetical protein